MDGLPLWAGCVLTPFAPQGVGARTGPHWILCKICGSHCRLLCSECDTAQCLRLHLLWNVYTYLLSSHCHTAQDSCQMAKFLRPSPKHIWWFQNMISLTTWFPGACLLKVLVAAQELKEISYFQGMRSFIAIFTRVEPWNPVLSEMNPVHTFTSCFSQLHVHLPR